MDSSEDIEVYCTSERRIYTSRQLMLWVEYVTPTKATREADPFLFGRSRDYWLLVLITPHAVDSETGDWRGNFASHLSVGFIKGSQMLTCLRTQASVSPVSDTFPREIP
ncbi:hypothetical protein TNCV_4378071 [Trichonephila clavipes]|nr:hypothetical protein TNCV_4378071 [Trichonephila clavipes]